MRRRFDREASALAVIASAHVVELISAGTAEDGRPFLVLERLDGRDLQEVLGAVGPLAPAQVTRVTGEAAAALELAHGLGIVHRDLEPANLFLHTTPARTQIVKVLDFGPAVSWLITGLLPLGLPHEHRVDLEPLDAPGPGPIGADEAATFAAVELFVLSARQAVPSFGFDDDSVADVVAICRAVEGFPLGIELAAAQLGVTSLPQIRAALEDDRPGSDTSTVRHAVARSSGLLAPGEQAILRHLALLPAGLTFEQVKREPLGVADEPAYAVLRLVQSHLLAWTSDQPRRLVMLDTVRELCHDTTGALGDEAALWQVACRHAEDITGAAAAAGQEAWLALIDAEHDNLATVLSHLQGAAPAVARRLAGQLAWYWYLRGHSTEGARWLEASITHSGAEGGDDLVRALYGAGRLALLSCRYQRAQELLARARARPRRRRWDAGTGPAGQFSLPARRRVTSAGGGSGAVPRAARGRGAASPQMSRTVCRRSTSDVVFGSHARTQPGNGPGGRGSDVSMTTGTPRRIGSRSWPARNSRPSITGIWTSRMMTVGRTRTRWAWS